MLSTPTSAGGPKAAEETLDARDITDRWISSEEPHRQAGSGRQSGQGPGAWLRITLLELAQGRGRYPARHRVGEAALSYPKILPG
jgi:hypothetical protein